MYGRVQGVGFRWFTLNTAQLIGIHGYVKNRPDGTVEILAQGNKDQLERFFLDIQKGPSFSLVESIQKEIVHSERMYHGFEVTY